jgi:hypothetical protein
LERVQPLTDAQLYETVLVDPYLTDEVKVSYGKISADELLQLMDAGYGAHIYLLQEEELCRDDIVEEIRNDTALNKGLVYVALYYREHGMATFYRDTEGEHGIMIGDPGLD